MRGENAVGDMRAAAAAAEASWECGAPVTPGRCDWEADAGFMGAGASAMEFFGWDAFTASGPDPDAAGALCVCVLCGASLRTLVDGREDFGVMGGVMTPLTAVMSPFGWDAAFPVPGFG